jgi:hypothetical protein
VSQDFLLLVFLWIRFPPAPECPIRTVSNFFQKSRRYWQLKVNHRCHNTTETGGKICRRCRWYRWSTFSCEYLREISKKFETALIVFSGAWGKLIHEKKQKQKISWHCPFNHVFVFLKLLLAHGSCFLRTFDHNKQFQAQLMPKVGTTASVFSMEWLGAVWRLIQINAYLCIHFVDWRAG